MTITIIYICLLNILLLLKEYANDPQISNKVIAKCRKSLGEIFFYVERLKLARSFVLSYHYCTGGTVKDN